jgi:hypothetical protein
MAGIQDFIEFVEDFLGPQTLTASPAGSDLWDIADTSSAGTPTYVVGGTNGEATITLASTSEVENVCLYQSDVLNYDIDKLIDIEFRIKMGQAALDAASQVAFGLCSARNDAIDSLAAHASFRVIGADSTTALVVETDDAVTDNDDVATGATLINAYKRCVISFAAGTSDVRFYVDGARVAASTTFDMSSYTSGLQPYVQIQKTADTNTDAVVVDYIKIRCRRA